jgi:hypothetical protein
MSASSLQQMGGEGAAQRSGVANFVMPAASTACLKARWKVEHVVAPNPSLDRPRPQD